MNLATSGLWDLFTGISFTADRHILHPTVDPLTSESPSVPYLGGWNTPGLGESVDSVLAQLEIFCDLWEGHPPIIHKGTHSVILFRIEPHPNIVKPGVSVKLEGSEYLSRCPQLLWAFLVFGFDE